MAHQTRRTVGISAFSSALEDYVARVVVFVVRGCDILNCPKRFYYNIGYYTGV